MVDVGANYHKIIARIGDAASKAGRKPEEIKLLAAAKAPFNGAPTPAGRAAAPAGSRNPSTPFCLRSTVKPVSIGRTRLLVLGEWCRW